MMAVEYTPTRGKCIETTTSSGRCPLDKIMAVEEAPSMDIVTRNRPNELFAPVSRGILNSLCLNSDSVVYVE